MVAVEKVVCSNFFRLFFVSFVMDLSGIHRGSDIYVTDRSGHVTQAHNKEENSAKAEQEESIMPKTGVSYKQFKKALENTGYTSTTSEGGTQIVSVSPDNTIKVMYGNEKNMSGLEIECKFKTDPVNMQENDPLVNMWAVFSKLVNGNEYRSEFLNLIKSYKETALQQVSIGNVYLYCQIYRGELYVDITGQKGESQ